jgi:hypothetical protein
VLLLLIGDEEAGIAVVHGDGHVRGHELRLVRDGLAPVYLGCGRVP